MALGNPLDEQGFFVVEKALDDEECRAVLQEVIATFSTASRTPIRKNDFRVHAPLNMTPRVFRGVQSALARGYDTVRSFLRRESYLVELSSITAFPGAGAQALHRDEYDLGKYIVSAFVNLAPTARGVGALAVIPGTHVNDDRPSGVPQYLELPAGSVVFINGKVCHAGTENTSADRFRPVFYFSIGDSDMKGPVYSIQPQLERRFKLEDFLRGRAPADAPVKLLDGLSVFESEDGALQLRMNRGTGHPFASPRGRCRQNRALLALAERPMPAGELAEHVGVTGAELLKLVRVANDRGIVVY